MKRTKIIQAFSILTAVFASLIFTSCGEKKDGGGDGNGEEAAAKVDTPDSLTDELATQMHRFADTLISAKDKESAQAAADALPKIGEDIADIASRLDKLETPSEEKKNELDAKMDKVQKELEAKMKESMTALMGNQEVAAILMPALQTFSQSMEKHDEVFERFGKKK